MGVHRGNIPDFRTASQLVENAREINHNIYSYVCALVFADVAFKIKYTSMKEPSLIAKWLFGNNDFMEVAVKRTFYLWQS